MSAQERALNLEDQITQLFTRKKSYTYKLKFTLTLLH
jgi:hypothetical protein